MRIPIGREADARALERTVAAHVCTVCCAESGGGDVSAGACCMGCMACFGVALVAPSSNAV